MLLLAQMLIRYIQHLHVAHVGGLRDDHLRDDKKRVEVGFVDSVFSCINALSAEVNVVHVLVLLDACEPVGARVLAIQVDIDAIRLHTALSSYRRPAPYTSERRVALGHGLGA